MNLTTPFYIGFANIANEILMHLAQWQYWWWFWFSFVWILYYLYMIKLLRKRKIKFKPKIATTLKPHGKWGDLIVCLIPLSWCLNILINSNFLLKLSEWQSECNTLNLKIKARQWYWIYKLDVRNFFKLNNIYKNVGHNRLIPYLNQQNYSNYTKFYKATARLLTNTVFSDVNFFAKKYKLDMSSVLKFSERFYLINFLFFSEMNELMEAFYKKKKYFFNFFSYSYVDSFLFFKKKKKLNLNTSILNLNFDEQLWNFKKKNYLINLEVKRTNIRKLQSFLSTDFQSKDLSDYDCNEYSTILLDDLTREYRLKESKLPYYVYTLNHTIFDPEFEKKINFLIDTYSENYEFIASKYLKEYKYYSFKQKRYKKRKRISKCSSMTQNMYFLNDDINESIYSIFENKTNLLRFFRSKYIWNKNIRTKNDIFFKNLNRRLLRTKRTLVLPAYLNINVVTNSLDVVHSWFLPGLGLKLDCIPGRSIHHTLYIDNPGFYYGQCAEICGRYHHHMPIRMCSLPFDHFLLWWTHFCIPRLFEKKKKNNLKLTFIW